LTTGLISRKTGNTSPKLEKKKYIQSLTLVDNAGWALLPKGAE
jgi:hypothetical protein